MARLEKFRRLLVRPALWPVVAQGVAPALEHWPVFDGIEAFATVLDAGANKGQFAAFAAARWPGARLICFEPLARPAERLARVLDRVAPGHAELHRLALGREAGTADMHVASREDSSSLRPLGALQKQLFAMEETETCAVPVLPLDAMTDLAIRGRTLLKIDVQGFEFEVLEGAASSLTGIDAVYVECSFMPLYDGQHLASDVIRLLEAAGFAEHTRRVTHHHDGAPVQADILFTRPA